MTVEPRLMTADELDSTPLVNGVPMEHVYRLLAHIAVLTESRDGYRAALARHEERIVEQVAAFVEATDINRWRLATMIRSYAWRKEQGR